LLPEMTVWSGEFRFAGETTALTFAAACPGVVAELAGSVTASVVANACSVGLAGCSGGACVSSSETCAQMSLMRAAPRPRMAAIAPSPAGTAACMNCPRERTVRTASAKLKVPAATCAEYSPSE
jgi:hypothetical protein